MDQFGIGPLGPAPWRLVELIGKGAHGNRDFDALDAEEVEAPAIDPFPIETRGGNPRVRQPGQRDVIENIVSCEASGCPSKAREMSAKLHASWSSI